MDIKVSRKERRWQPDGPVDVLLGSVCDVYPIFADDPKYARRILYNSQGVVSLQDRKNLIMDVEIIDDEQEEQLDRAMFAVMKQRGGDPTEPEDGVQWAEAVIGEVLPLTVVQQVCMAVSEEGSGVRAVPQTVRSGGKDHLTFKIELTGIN